MRDETLTRDQAGALEEPQLPRLPDEPDGAGTRDDRRTGAGPAAAGTAPAAAAPATAEPATVWPAETANGFRERWQEIQLRFVDDPRSATSDAEALLAEVLDAFSETLAAHKAEVDTWGDAGDAEGADVERLRNAVRRYRELLERLLGV